MSLGWRFYLSILQLRRLLNFLFADFVLELKLPSALDHVRLDFYKGPSHVAEPAGGDEELLPQELTVDVVNVVIGVTLREPDPGVLVVIAVNTDDGGQAGDVGTGDGAGNHALLDLVNTPDMILDASKVH